MVFIGWYSFKFIKYIMVNIFYKLLFVILI